MFTNRFKGKRVWLSGQTGFKGAWLSEWLLSLGAEVHGFALPPSTTPSLFEQLGLASRVGHEIGDIRDQARVTRSILASRPDFVFHLAAQPLVRQSYVQPVETYATNVMGTVHVLEALKGLGENCIAVFITTDKCYENREWLHGYREEDPVGGYDPYSSSKAMAELAISAYRRSYFQSGAVTVASARAGNVIGGGDWAADRIVPDCIRHLQSGKPLPVRNRLAIRPWQHVLEPLSGYLWLAARLKGAREQGVEAVQRLAGAYNFGPSLAANHNVEELVQEIFKSWPGQWRDASDPAAPHEAGRLNLATDKAFHQLGWQPVWSFAETVRETVQWYQSVQQDPAQARPLLLDQIRRYQWQAAENALPWMQE